jgi:hypothetical protein
MGGKGTLKRPLGQSQPSRSKRKGYDNTKMVHMKIVCEERGWMELAGDPAQCCVMMLAALKLAVALLRINFESSQTKC